MFEQNECQLTGEVKERITLQWTNKGFPYVDFCLKLMKADHYKQKVTQFIRCTCYGPQAIYIAEKVVQGEKINIKGSLDSRRRCFEEGFYEEVIVTIKQCYPARQQFENNTTNFYSL